MDLPKTPSFRLDGRRALVTGGGRGLGVAAAAALAEAGAAVEIIARSEDEIAEVCEAIKEQGGNASYYTLDVMDYETARNVLLEKGPYDILVNNAGTNRPKYMPELTRDDFDAVMDLNVKAAFFVAHTIAEVLVKAEKPGVILNMSSQMGHVAGPKRTIYCASKHAVEGFTKAMALELAPKNIRVNTIAPTFIMTEMVREGFKDETFKNYVMSKIKLGRMGELEDIMGAIVFLASDAAALITGTSLLIDGGWTLD